MKKSEMIEDIASEMIREEINFPSFNKAKIVAEHILNRIEKQGMLPPSVQINPNYSNARIPACYKNEWESEDE
jgi:hypothetical protein